MPDGTMHEARLSVDVDGTESQFIRHPAPPHAGVHPCAFSKSRNGSSA